MRYILAMLVFVSFVFAKPKIVVEDAWVRAVPPVSTVSAGFMKLKNLGDEEDVLIGVESDISEVGEIHTTYMEDGFMKMRMLKEVKVPAGGSVEFKPGGKHLMLINLNKHPKKGDKVKLILRFKKTGTLEVEAEVR